MKTGKRLVSAVIFVLVLSNMLLSGAIPGLGSGLRRPDANQSLEGASSSAMFSHVGSRGQAASAGIVDVNALPVPLRPSGKTWSTFLSSKIGSGPSSESNVSPSILATTSSSSVALSGGFDGLNMSQSCKCYPPDVIVAAGPNHVVEMVNLEGEIFTKQGSSVKIFSLQSFFNSSVNHLISDPKVLFDPISGRWFASLIEYWVVSGSLKSQVDIAVSQSNDPIGSWSRYFVQPSIQVIPNPVAGVTDQPIIGVSDDKFVVSVNMFANEGSGTEPLAGSLYWILNKSEMVNGASTIDFASFGPYPQFESVHPVQSMSSTTIQYMVSTGGGDLSSGPSNSVQLFSVTGLPPGNVTSQTLSLSVSTIQEPPLGSQPQTTSKINPDDYRVLDAAWQNGVLWLTLNDGCTPAGDTQQRSCVRLIQINTTAPTVKQDFDYGTSGLYFFYPALRIDGSGNLDVIYGYSSSTVFPSLAVTGQLTTDPAGSLAPPTTLKLGRASDNTQLFSPYRPRYGDYFGAGVDPIDTGKVWVAGEYIGDSQSLCSINCWSTFIGTTSMNGYGIVASPSSLTIQAGSSAVSTITLTSVAGFSGTVRLSTSVPPGGLSAALSSSKVSLSAGGSASETLTVSNAAAASPGKYVIAVTGTSGSVVRSSFVTTIIPDFSVSTNPVLAVAAAGSSAISTVTVDTSNGFQGTVRLSVSPSTGLSCSLNPPSVTLGAPGTSSLSCTSAAVGNYSAVVTGVSGSVSHPVTVNVTMAPFRITANPATISLTVGSTGTSTISLTSVAGFSGTVTLGIQYTSYIPAAIRLSLYSLKLNPGGTNSSTLTIVTYTWSYPWNYSFTVVGSGGGFSNSVPITLFITDYSITATPAAVALKPNSPGNSTITVTSLGSFTGVVSLSSSISPPTGLTCSVTPSSVTLGVSANSTLRCSASSGSYLVTVTATSGTLSHTVSVQFGVNDFTISAQSTALAAAQGSSGSDNVNVFGASGLLGYVMVSLTVTGPPAGATAVFSPSSVYAFANSQSTSTLIVSPSSNSPLGSYTITITGSAGGVSHSTTVTLQVLTSSYTIAQTTTVFTGVSVTYSGSLTVNTASSLSMTGSMSYTATNSTTGSFIDSATVNMNLPINLGGSAVATSAIEIPSSPYWTSVTCIFFVAQGTFNCGITRTLDIDHDGTIDSYDLSVVRGALNCSMGMSCYVPAADLQATGTVTFNDYSIESSHFGGPLFLPADYTLSSNPTGVSFLSGSSGTSTITAVSLYGFTGTVSLSMTFQSGLMCMLNPTTITPSSSSALTCNAPNTGVFNSTISGSSGPMLHSITVTVNVVPYAISASPATMQVYAGAMGTSSLTLTAGSTFSGTINLTATVSPAGPTVSVSPSSLSLQTRGTGSATLTVSASNTATGNYYVTITAKSGATIATVTVAVAVTDFQVSGLQSFQIPAGYSFYSTITVTGISGFTGTVSLSWTLSTTSFSCSFTPASVTLGAPASSSLICPGTIGGSYTITVTGTSGSLSHTLSTTFTVSDYAFTASPTALTAGRLSYASATLTIKTNVQYSCCGAGISASAPSGIIVTYNDPYQGNGIWTAYTYYIYSNQQYSLGVTVLVDSSVQPGTYTVTLTSTAAATTHTLTLTVIVPSFSLTADPSSFTFTSHSSGTSTITVTSINGYTGTILFSGTVSTPGLTCLLTPASATLGSSATASLTCQGSAGSYVVTVIGTNNSMSHSVSINVTVIH